MKTKAVALLIVGLLVIAAAMPSVAAEVTQTTGVGSWCSPAQNGNGNTVICNGVPPSAIDGLNERLNREDLDLKQKITEANDWARKYFELSAQIEEQKKQLTIHGESITPIQKAQDLLDEGKLDEAVGILQRRISNDVEARISSDAQCAHINLQSAPRTSIRFGFFTLDDRGNSAYNYMVTSNYIELALDNLSGENDLSFGYHFGFFGGIQSITIRCLNKSKFKCISRTDDTETRDVFHQLKTMMVDKIVTNSRTFRFRSGDAAVFKQTMSCLTP
jgi:hypothetical protein